MCHFPQPGTPQSWFRYANLIENGRDCQEEGNPSSAWGIGKRTKKAPILIDGGFFDRRSRPNGLTSDTGKHAFPVTIPKG